RMATMTTNTTTTTPRPRRIIFNMEYSPDEGSGMRVSAPGGQLRFGHTLDADRTFLGDGPDFDDRSVWDAGTLPGDRGGFLEIFHPQKKVTADGFLGFSERAVGHASMFPGNNPALGFERAAGDRLAFFREAFEPGGPLAGDLLHFLGRKAFAPVVPAKDQHVS